MYSAKKGDSSITLDMNVSLCGDVLIRVHQNSDTSPVNSSDTNVVRCITIKISLLANLIPVCCSSESLELIFLTSQLTRYLSRYGFHTSFIDDGRLVLPVTELDGAGHGRFSSDSFPSNFTILNIFSEIDQQPGIFTAL